ncbi:hypothetical protein KZ858_13210, partial [Pseudomonas aeruginosa]|nr:hypothetical protein [Pseudomonas aeruginosa]
MWVASAVGAASAAAGAATAWAAGDWRACGGGLWGGRAGGRGWVPAKDGPPALPPAYMAWNGVRTPSLFTIHNLAYQGL